MNINFFQQTSGMDFKPSDIGALKGLAGDLLRWMVSRRDYNAEEPLKVSYCILS